LHTDAAEVLLETRSWGDENRHNQVMLGTSHVLQVGIAAAAAPHESATTTAEVQTGLLELNKETFSDYINAAGDALVVVDFFTDVSLLAPAGTVSTGRAENFPFECVPVAPKQQPVAVETEHCCAQLAQRLQQTRGLLFLHSVCYCLRPDSLFCSHSTVLHWQWPLQADLPAS
jgi:hypothetical protein